MRCERGGAVSVAPDGLASANRADAESSNRAGAGTNIGAGVSARLTNAGAVVRASVQFLAPLTTGSAARDAWHEDAASAGRADAQAKRHLKPAAGPAKNATSSRTAKARFMPIGSSISSEAPSFHVATLAALRSAGEFRVSR
jgi:hypothetical protein